MSDKVVTIQNGQVVDFEDGRSLARAIAQKQAKITTEAARRLSIAIGQTGLDTTALPELVRLIVRMISDEELRAACAAILDAEAALKGGVVEVSTNAEADAFDHGKNWP